MKKIFVFVVCGAKEHIDTLHFSLKALKKFSENEIIVLTDSTRNEIVILHEQIVDIQTPVHFDNHQASIYLKTGIHQFLPRGNNYCYLDTDVIALSGKVDLIFNEFKPPIIFAADHIKLKEFSRYAIHCNCYEEWLKAKQNFQQLSKHYFISSPELQEKIKALKIRLNKPKNRLTSQYERIQFKLSKKRFQLSQDFFFNKELQRWEDKEGNALLYDKVNEIVAEKSGYHLDNKNNEWLDKNGLPLEESKAICSHLQEAILETFNIEIKNENWQHWNGGVFLFNDESHDFLASWHKKTLKIFEKSNWQTRDQGTLVATAWEFGLHNHDVLDKKWNFLADYNNDKLDFNENGFFTLDAWQTQDKVNFAHIYHHWGDKKWPLWKWIENKVNE